MVYKPNTQQFHITYANRKKIWYRYSSDDGDSWGIPLALGKGKFPCIALSTQGYPCVTWTDDDGGIWFRRHTGTVWSAVYHPYSPTGQQVRLNAAPAMAITPSSRGDTVHILVTLLNRSETTNGVAEFAFPIAKPMDGYFSYIESQGPVRTNPSICRCAVDTSIHAVWQRADTVCYAKRGIHQTWTNYGHQYQYDGTQSAYPFVETYGDSIFVVWQHLDSITNIEDIYRGCKYLSLPEWSWANLSQTSMTVSSYGVNASGLATCFVDNTMMFAKDIYWKRVPDDPLNNISQSTMVASLFPQACLRFNLAANNQLYVLWQEGDSLRFELKFKMEYVPGIMNPAFLTSPGGLEQGNPYLVQRDTFFTGWSTPVDAGNSALSYRFPLEPGYAYKVKASVYHEGSGEWKELIRIDTLQVAVSYPAGQVKTIEAWIPTALYENDGCINVSVSRITGNYAVMGPVHVYRYETGGRPGPGGVMAQATRAYEPKSIIVTPNPFNRRLSIQSSNAYGQLYVIKIYDITGRLVTNLVSAWDGRKPLVWNGKDIQNHTVVPGVYLLQMQDLNSGETLVKKVVKID
jgi:hypothetical protein